MKNQKISVDPGLFRSRMVPGALICCLLGAMTGGVQLILMLTPGYWDWFCRDLIAGGIAADWISYSVMHVALGIAAVVCPVILAVGLAVTLRGRPARGLCFLSSAAKFAMYGLNAGGIALLGLFGFRFVRYIVICCRYAGGIQRIYAMVVSEALMLVVAWFLHRLLCRFLDAVAVGGVSMAVTLSSGQVDSFNIPGFASTGFGLLGIFCLAQAVGQVLTMTIVGGVFGASYRILVADYPGAWVAALSMALCAAANFLLWQYLRQYKRICERALFEGRKRLGKR